ncbi:TPA: hypothetical protein I8235_000842 [Kluyvera intermedia]|uniref:hypothetical protein n=1 Tax=Citrobacter sp. MNAZ 1397 TaxID=2911205 RepID=UPI001A193D82|nr:hypothetical protein [Citrobacter sp. MNAZ 1397]MCL9670583.1 hypothetical protein [Citrobacter sp. MNAZ 1397]HAT2607908.1 hypothetical protein [Kluyvera intermedia]
MAGIVALVYFVVGFVAFTRKIKLFTIASSLLLFAALKIIAASQVLTFFFIALLVSVFVVLTVVKTDRDTKSIFYFSLPCWLLIGAVLIYLFYLT